MSYASMDHAAWVEQNNKASNRIYAHRKKYLPAPESLTEFQAKVVDILGMVFGGIYNAPIAWNSTDWVYGSGMSVVLNRRKPEMATFDFCHLTSFVFLCHEARIRGSIEPGGFHSFRLSFWQRSSEGGMGRRHPNLDEAVAAFRTWLPKNHRINSKEGLST